MRMIGVFMICGAISFTLGLKTVSVDPVGQTIAQASETTTVNVILQYQPISGGDPVPIEVTPFMNSSQSALLHFQEIHTASVVPYDPDDRCINTNSLGRCSVSDIPVGPDGEGDFVIQMVGGGTGGGTGYDQQYDVLIDTVFIEFLTGIALDRTNSYIKYDPAACSGNQTNFSGDTWCLTKSGGSFAQEYFITVTLAERNDCMDSSPPASYCDQSGELITFECNPSFNGPTRPWEPVDDACGTVQCPDGNYTSGICSEITPEFAACSKAESCRNNLLCDISSFGASSYDAGTDTVVIRGERFGNAGGTVSFPVANNEREVVEVFAGPDWTDTRIRVRVPISAESGTLEIHPRTHGFTEEGGVLIPVICTSPAVSILSVNDQFAILNVTGRPQDGVRLVSPGYTTELQILVHHNDKVGNLNNILVELLDGSFPDANDVSISRKIITSTSCSVSPPSGGNVKDATLMCDVPITEDALTYHGPYTFLVTVTDGQGNSQKAVLLDAGESVLAGDFNLDGILSIADAVFGRRLASGTMQAMEDHLIRDVDGDGEITMSDAIFVLHMLTE